MKDCGGSTAGAGPANYGVFTIAMSALVVLLLAFAGVSPKKVILVRGEMTCLVLSGIS